MKKFKIFTLCMLGLAGASLTSCSSQSDEITSYILGRNLSPINLEANNVQETTADIRWTPSANATSYNLQIFAEDSLSYDMSGTPAATITGITEDDLPVTVSGLFYDTKYTVYVQAITDDNASRTSTWNGAYFRTSSKQFLKNPKPAEIADRSVTLTWEVEDGYDVSTIVIGDIKHEITTEEKEAGQATIEGLTPETAYTAYLYYNGKQCGNRNFTTIADLTGCIILHDGDDLKKAIEAEDVEDGAVFALYGGTYNLNATYDEDSGELISTGAVKIYKTITIKGIYPTDQPKVNGRFEIYDGAGLSISQCKIDGSKNSDTGQIFNYKLDAASDGTTFNALDIQSCEITGLADTKGIIYMSGPKSAVESVTINNCIVYGIECNGGDFIDFRTGYPKSLTLSNSTFYHVATKRDFIRLDDASGNFAEGTAGPVVKMDKCTLYDVCNETSGKRIYYVRFIGNSITNSNNLIVNTQAVYTNQSKTGEIAHENNYYYGCTNANIFAASNPEAEPAAFWNGDVNGKNGEDPNFKNTANGDFTIGNENVSKVGAGDPRWITAQ